jgi:hypothetical protein
MFEVKWNFSKLWYILLIKYLIEHFRVRETFEDASRHHNLNGTMPPRTGNGS